MYVALGYNVSIVNCKYFQIISKLFYFKNPYIYMCVMRNRIQNKQFRLYLKVQCADLKKM